MLESLRGKRVWAARLAVRCNYLLKKNLIQKAQLMKSKISSKFVKKILKSSLFISFFLLKKFKYSEYEWCLINNIKWSFKLFFVLKLTNDARDAYNCYCTVFIMTYH